MPDTKTHHPKNKNLFLKIKNASWMSKVVLILFVVLLCFALVDQHTKKQNEISAVDAEVMEKEYSEWLANKDDSEKKELLQTLLEDKIKHSGTLGKVRALFLQGQMFYDEKKYDEAVNSFKTIAQKFSATYLTPLALFNAGSILSEIGKQEEAINVWEEILDKKYSQKWFFSPTETIFNLASSYEQLNNSPMALKFYNQIIEKYPESKWTDVAKSRQIWLNIHSKNS